MDEEQVEMLKILVQVAGLILPWPLRRQLLNHVCGFSIDAKARIGISIILARAAHIDRGASVGHFNYVGKLDRLHLDEEAIIGDFNWIVGLPPDTPFYRKNPSRRSELFLGRGSMIGHRHYIDCTDRIEIGEFSGLAGIRSQLLTHGIEPLSSRQTCAPISIGDHTMIGSGCLITKGVKVPRCCLVSAGSVVGHVKPEPYSLIAGNPAVHVRSVPETAKFFSRTEAVLY
jgi:acetyltransferase-like isoleucine patch superfamily enzyme